MTGFKPKRFDVAGAHPDEAYRAVANIAEAVEDLRKQFGGEHFREFPEANAKIGAWQSSKPLRFGNARDADVQQFLERGVKIMDGLEMKLPLGLNQKQREIRNRCGELAKSMQKVLDRRPDEPLLFDPWRPVKINVEAVKDSMSARETRARYARALSGCFPRGPGQADRARTQYRVWEQNAERFHKEGPMNEAAQSWKRFMGVIENMRSREQAKGVVWGRVDDVTGIDFKPALTARPAYQSKPRMRI
jgi:hypothetical protein